MITAAGSGSGINVESIVTSLLDAERTPVTQRLNLREIQIQAEVSAFGSLQGALSEFQTSLSPLAQADNFSTKAASSSNQDVFTVNASATAPVGRFDVEVRGLAQADKLTSSNFANPDSEVGSGTLNIQLGTESFSISVANSTNSMKLSAIRDSINQAQDNVGVTASILTVDDGAGGTASKLVLTSTKTGEANAITVTTTDDDGNNTDTAGLSNLVYDPGNATNLTRTNSAADAEITVDGFLVKSSTNEFKDVIDGVTINAVKADVGNTHSLSVSNSTAGANNSIKSVVDNFNALATTLNFLTDYDQSKNEAGLLTGDATVRLMESQMRRTLTGQVTGVTGSFDSLASLGITTNKQGQLEIDSSKLSSALSSDPAAVAEIFTGDNGIVKQLEKVLDGFLGSNGVIQTKNDSFNKQLEDINEQRGRLELRLDSLETRYRAQFTQMDILVAQFQQTGNFLTQQLAVTQSIITRKSDN